MFFIFLFLLELNLFLFDNFLGMILFIKLFCVSRVCRFKW